MCGRYALAMRPGQVRQQLEDAHLPASEAPDDDAVRHTYNFAPGSHGMVYRASRAKEHGSQAEAGNAAEKPSEQEAEADASLDGSGKVSYKLQAMKWGE
jgi:putative SOS response-associated peptidase YedK